MDKDGRVVWFYVLYFLCITIKTENEGLERGGRELKGGLPKSNCRGFPMSNVQCGHHPKWPPTSDIPISWIFPCHAGPDTQTAATARYLFISRISSCTLCCNRYRDCTMYSSWFSRYWAEVKSGWISDPGLAAFSSLVCVCSSPILLFPHICPFVAIYQDPKLLLVRVVDSKYLQFRSYV